MATPDNTEALGVSTEPLSTFQKAETYLNKNRADSSSQSYRDVIAVYNEEAQQQGAPAWNSSFLTPMDPTAEMGFIEGIKESFTGNARETESTQRLPSYTRMPELNQILNSGVVDSLQTSAGLMQGTPQEMAQIIKAQFPDIEVRQDENANYIFRSSMDGKEYVIKPGFGEGDTTRFLGQTALMAPATIMAGAAALTAGAAGVGILPILATGAALYGLSSIGYQLYQKSIGGEFNYLDVAMDTLAPAGIETAAIGLKQAAKTVTPVIKSTWGKATNRFRAPEEIGTSSNKTNDEIQLLFNRAKDGDIEAQQELADMGTVDLEVIAAANELGISQHLQPDHVSTDTQFIELMQLIKSWKGSTARKEELTGLQNLGEEVIERVKAAGAQEPGDMSKVVYTRLQDTINTLGEKADGLWNKFRTSVGIEGASDVPPAYFNPEQLLAKIETKLRRLNGNEKMLRPYERDFKRLFSPKNIMSEDGKTIIGVEYPSIDMFEAFRRDLADGMSSTPTGSYMNQSESGLKRFYGSVLEQERLAVQENFGIEVLEAFDLARATSQLRFGAIDDQKSIFGKLSSEYLGGNLDQGMRALTKGDTDKLVKFMEAIPDEDKANVLMTGLKMQFGNATKTGKLNFNTFSKWYESVLAEKEAYGILQKYLPEETLQTFNNIYRVSNSINRALQERVYNGATMQLSDFLTAEGVMSGIYELAKNAGKLGAAETISTTVGLPGAAIAAALIRSMGKTTTTKARDEALKSADALLTSPSFMNMVTEQYSEESIQRFALSSSWQNFARKVGLPPRFASEFVRSIYAATTSSVNTGETSQPLPSTEEPATPPAAPPQARVMPSAPPTRGVPGLGSGQPAPAAPAVAQGPANSQSREMLQQLFPEERLA
jgi:hypothetical protein